MGRHTRRVKRLHRRYGQQAVDVYLGWRAVRRPLACARYVDGMLAWCEYQGDGFWELEDVRPTPGFVPPLPLRQANTGMHRLDLRAEERRSGVPVWFMPNASRRRRAHAWTHESPCRWVYYEGHLLSITYGGRIKHHHLELMLYLPIGENPFAPHHSEVWHALLEG